MIFCDVKVVARGKRKKIPIMSFCKPIINCSKHSTFARLFLLDFFEVRRRSW